MKRCVFFDRDGIVNQSPGPGYVERWEDFHLLAGFVRVLGLVRERGYEAVIVTNQRGVARGLLPEAELRQMHANLRNELDSTYGLQLLDILYCPHENGVCDCRKPAPGMLLEAACRHGLDLGASWMVGDNERDVGAGHNAGCRTVLVAPSEAATAAEYHVTNLNELESLFRRVLQERNA